MVILSHIFLSWQNLSDFAWILGRPSPPTLISTPPHLTKMNLIIILFILYNYVLNTKTITFEYKKKFFISNR